MDRSGTGYFVLVPVTHSAFPQQRQEPHHEQIFSDNSQTIGNTPLVRINHISDGNIYVKLESRNPAMSVKCRIGSSMVLAAEKDGSLKPA